MRIKCTASEDGSSPAVSAPNVLCEAGLSRHSVGAHGSAGARSSQQCGPIRQPSCAWRFCLSGSAADENVGNFFLHSQLLVIRRNTPPGNSSVRNFSWGGGSRACPGVCVRNECVKFRVKPKACANQGVRAGWWGVRTLIDFRGGGDRPGGIHRPALTFSRGNEKC